MRLGYGYPLSTIFRLVNRESKIRNPLRQALPFDQLHAEVMPALALAGLVDGNNVRMIEVCRSFGFGAKAFDGFGRGELLGRDQLERHGAVQAELPRPIDDAHPAVADLT